VFKTFENRGGDKKGTPSLGWCQRKGKRGKTFGKIPKKKTGDSGVFTDHVIWWCILGWGHGKEGRRAGKEGKDQQGTERKRRN